MVYRITKEGFIFLRSLLYPRPGTPGIVGLVEGPPGTKERQSLDPRPGSNPNSSYYAGWGINRRPKGHDTIGTECATAHEVRSTSLYSRSAGPKGKTTSGPLPIGLEARGGALSE